MAGVSFTMRTSTALSGSLEDYLEVIFHLVSEKQVARVKDIARRLGVRSSSVTGALRSLSSRGLINYTPYDVITLTPKGRVAAKDVVRRHEVLRDFFVKVLAIDFQEADEAACKMEHSLSRHIFERFIEFVEFVEVCPRGGSTWPERFEDYCHHGRDAEHCEKCITEALEEIHKVAQTRG